MSSIKLIDTEQAKLTGIEDVFEDDAPHFPVPANKQKKTGVRRRAKSRRIDDNIVGKTVALPFEVVSQASSVLLDAINKLDNAAGISNSIGSVASYSTMGMNSRSADPTVREVSALLRKSVQNLAMHDPTGMISPEVNDVIYEDDAAAIDAAEMELETIAEGDEELERGNDLEANHPAESSNKL